ncbi:DUF6241 domain-containing protein [Gracilibacillus caseinilyticus]|uniref:DUF6241 domain-containing protein n=1 Tax=Gracilibacillus caseinilyticus TaxID=2932256 RepID=A0ABY4F070_9BACI|nr:DUF6241 domain-containing protein [Gracilibacillus caseinilyticus]UOQ49595.1 DUF6241 domain-containing protein [Gracilibacillus caseinilyticus]
MITTFLIVRLCFSYHLFEKMQNLLLYWLYIPIITNKIDGKACAFLDIAKRLDTWQSWKGGIILVWNKIYKWTLIICLTSFAGIASFLGYDMYQSITNLNETYSPSSSSETSSATVSGNEADEATETSAESDPLVEFSEKKVAESDNKASLNPFGDPFTIEDLTDEIVLEYLNFMSHQKVHAADKWGFYQITPERITYLLKALEEKEFNHESLYREILTKWKNNDFSQAVSDHNRIWAIQNGNVGKATRLLTEEEEQKILDKYKN